MFHTNRYLKLCEQLAAAGAVTDYHEGACLARGFADLGYEQFVLLPGDKLLSLFTGKISILAEEERKRFFQVWEPDQLVQAIQGRGAQILEIAHRNQRNWHLVLQVVSNKTTSSLDADTLQEVLAQGLLQLLKS